MNFTFTVKVHGFLNAATLEETLKKNSISYTAEPCATPIAAPAKKSIYKDVELIGTKRPRLTLAKVRYIETEIAAHPDWAYEDIAERCDVSRTTISRVAQGTHALLRGAK
jgi:hypothetical protein